MTNVRAICPLVCGPLMDRGDFQDGVRAAATGATVGVHFDGRNMSVARLGSDASRWNASKAWSLINIRVSLPWRTPATRLEGARLTSKESIKVSCDFSDPAKKSFLGVWLSDESRANNN